MKTRKTLDNNTSPLLPFTRRLSASVQSNWAVGSVMNPDLEPELHSSSRGQEGSRDFLKPLIE